MAGNCYSGSRNTNTSCTESQPVNWSRWMWSYLLVWHWLCWRLSQFFKDIDSAGECGEVVPSLAIEEAGVSQTPHILCLYLCPMEPTLDKDPHKQW